MFRKRRALVATSAAFMLIFSACGGDDAATESSTKSTLNPSNTVSATTAAPTVPVDSTAILKYGSMQANSLDPAVQKTPCEVTQMRLLYDTLTVFDANDKLQPMLATEWKLDSPTVLTMKLRTDVKFQDGTPFNADAVKFVLDRALTSAESNIKTTLFMLQSVDVVDASTVKLTMKTPAIAPLLAALADRPGMMYSPTAFKAAGNTEAWTKKPVGSGMYKLEGEYRPIESMSVRSWDGYWDTKTPRLGGIDMTEIKVDALVNAIKSGQYDMVPIDSAQQVSGLKGESSIVVRTDASIQVRSFLMNPTEKPFDDLKVRQAVAHAIDRKAIAEVMTEGLSGPTSQWYPKGSLPYDAGQDNLYPFDLEKAKKLLTEAGYPNGFDVKATVGDSSTSYIQQIELIQAMLKKININITIEKIPTAQMVPSVYPTDATKKSTIISLPWASNLTVDPDNWFRVRYLADGNTNLGRYEVPGLKTLLDQAAAASDDAARTKLYGEASKLVNEGLYQGVTLFFVPAIMAMKDYVGGLPKATTRCPATLRGLYITQGKVPAAKK